MAVAHLPLDRIAHGIRSLGVKCVVVEGAQGRSARAYPEGFAAHGCQANVLHHTVSSGDNYNNDIGFILGGKGPGYVIANAYTSTGGTVYLLASGPTYTEGAGGPRGIIPSGGGNRVCNSNEIANWGNGIDVYSPAQCKAVEAWAAVCAPITAEIWRWLDNPFGPTRLFSHFEWSPGRKIDPLGPSQWSTGGMWNMDKFRADARRVATSEEFDVQVVNQRIMDTRWPGVRKKMQPEERNEFGIDLATLVPKNARLLSVNFTATEGSGVGYVSFAKPGDSIGGTSCLNFVRGQAVANNVFPVPLVDGKFSVSVYGSPTHLICDVFGYVL